MFPHELNISCNNTTNRLARFEADSFAFSMMNCNVIIVATAHPELADLYSFNKLHIYTLRIYQVNKILKNLHHLTRILSRVCEVRRTWNIIFLLVFLHAMFYEASSMRNTVMA